MLLPLTGPTGLVTAIPLALWLGWSGLQSAPKSPIRIAASILALSISTLYLVGLERTEYLPSSPGILSSLTASVQFISMSLGPWGEKGWPLTGVIIHSICFVSLMALHSGNQGDRNRIETTRGLASFLATILVLALAIGWGRAGWGDDAGFRRRYATNAVPLLWGIYLIWTIRGEAITSKLVRNSLAIFMAIAILPYARLANDFTGFRSRLFQELRQEALAGQTPKQLAAHHWADVYYGEPGAAWGFQLMHDSSIGPWAGLPLPARHSRIGTPPGKTWRTIQSPDGATLAHGRDDGLVELTDLSGKDKGRILRGHDGEIRAMAFSPDGHLLATAGWDRTVRVWDTAKGEAVMAIRGSPGVVESLEFSRDGKSLSYKPAGGSMVIIALSAPAIPR